MSSEVMTQEMLSSSKWEASHACRRPKPRAGRCGGEREATGGRRPDKVLFAFFTTPLIINIYIPVPFSPQPFTNFTYNNRSRGAPPPPAPWALPCPRKAPLGCLLFPQPPWAPPRSSPPRPPPPPHELRCRRGGGPRSVASSSCSADPPAARPRAARALRLLGGRRAAPPPARRGAARRAPRTAAAARARAARAPPCRPPPAARCRGELRSRAATTPAARGRASGCAEGEGQLRLLGREGGVGVARGGVRCACVRRARVGLACGPIVAGLQ